MPSGAPCPPPTSPRTVRASSSSWRPPPPSPLSPPTPTPSGSRRTPSGPSPASPPPSRRGRSTRGAAGPPPDPRQQVRHHPEEEEIRAEQAALAAARHLPQGEEGAEEGTEQDCRLPVQGEEEGRGDDGG